MELTGKIAGWKCGATNEQAQAALGLAEPFRGPLYPEMIIEAGKEAVPHEPFDIEYMGVTGVEAEFGIHLREGLPPREEPYKMKEVYESVAGVSPIMEICCSRFLQVPASMPLTASVSSPPLHWFYRRSNPRRG